MKKFTNLGIFGLHRFVFEVSKNQNGVLRKLRVAIRSQTRLLLKNVSCRYSYGVNEDLRKLVSKLIPVAVGHILCKMRLRNVIYAIDVSFLTLARF